MKEANGANEDMAYTISANAETRKQANSNIRKRSRSASELARRHQQKKRRGKREKKIAWPEKLEGKPEKKNLHGWHEKWQNKSALVI